MTSTRHVPGEVAKAAATGNQRQALEAMRDKLAAAMDTAPDSVVAQVAARLQAVVAAIALLPDVEKVSTADEIRARRDARRANAEPGTPAAKARKAIKRA